MVEKRVSTIDVRKSNASLNFECVWSSVNLLLTAFNDPSQIAFSNRSRASVKFPWFAIVIAPLFSLSASINCTSLPISSFSEKHEKESKPTSLGRFGNSLLSL